MDAAHLMDRQIADQVIEVPMISFKVFPQYRVQLRLVEHNTLTFLLLVEALVVFLQDRIQQRRLRRPSTFLLLEVLVVFVLDRILKRLLPCKMLSFRLVEVFKIYYQDRFQRRLLDLITSMSTCLTPPSGCSSVTPPRASPVTGTDAPARRSGSHLRASESSGSARRALEGRSGTGTRLPVPVHMTSVLCPPCEAHRGVGLGIISPHLGCQRLWPRSSSTLVLWLVCWS